MAKRHRVFNPRSRAPKTNWTVLVLSAVCAGLLAGLLVVTVPLVPWDTRGGGEPTGANLRGP